MKKIDLKKIKKLWQRGASEKALKSEGLDLNKQWRRAFTFFVVLMFGLVIFEIRMFFMIDQDSIFSSVSPKSVEVESISRSEIIEVLEYYDEKKRRFNSLTSSQVNFPAPEETTDVATTTEETGE